MKIKKSKGSEHSADLSSEADLSVDEKTSSENRTNQLKFNLNENIFNSNILLNIIIPTALFIKIIIFKRSIFVYNKKYKSQMKICSLFALFAISTVEVI